MSGSSRYTQISHNITTTCLILHRSPLYHQNSTDPSGYQDIGSRSFELWAGGWGLHGLGLLWSTLNWTKIWGVWVKASGSLSCSSSPVWQGALCCWGWRCHGGCVWSATVFRWVVHVKVNVMTQGYLEKHCTVPR